MTPCSAPAHVRDEADPASCLCNPGFGTQNSDVCKQCLPGKYQSEVETTPCWFCPDTTMVTAEDVLASSLEHCLCPPGTWRGVLVTSHLLGTSQVTIETTDGKNATVGSDDLQSGHICEPCFGKERSCAGETRAGGYGNWSCHEGHTGPNCGVCLEGFSYSVGLRSCEPCPSFDVVVSFVAVTILPLIVFCALCIYLRELVSLLIPATNIKMLLGYLAILINVPETYLYRPPVDPRYFIRMAVGEGFTNIDLTSINSCIFSVSSTRTAFYRGLIAWILLPYGIAVFGGLLILLAHLEYAGVTSELLCTPDRLFRARRRYRDRVITVVGPSVVILTLIHPAVASNAISIFGCEQLLGHAEQYLNSAWNVVCYDAAWRAAAGAVMVFGGLYVLGLPLGLAWALYTIHTAKGEASEAVMVSYKGLRRLDKERDKLKGQGGADPQNKMLLQDLTVEANNLLRWSWRWSWLNFMHKGYRDNFYFFDVIEILKRSILISGMAVFGQVVPGAELLAGTLLSVMFCLEQSSLQPYLRHITNKTKIWVEVVVTTTMLSMLTLTVDTNEYDKGMVDWLIGVTNFFVLCVVLWFFWQTLKRTVLEGPAMVKLRIKGAKLPHPTDQLLWLVRVWRIVRRMETVYLRNKALRTAPPAPLTPRKPLPLNLIEGERLEGMFALVSHRQSSSSQSPAPNSNSPSSDSPTVLPGRVAAARTLRSAHDATPVLETRSLSPPRSRRIASPTSMEMVAAALGMPPPKRDMERRAQSLINVLSSKPGVTSVFVHSPTDSERPPPPPRRMSMGAIATDNDVDDPVSSPVRRITRSATTSWQPTLSPKGVASQPRPLKPLAAVAELDVNEGWVAREESEEVNLPHTELAKPELDSMESTMVDPSAVHTSPIHRDDSEAHGPPASGDQ